MRVYQLMTQEHGLNNLKKRRLKLSLLSDMNDPFELMCISLPDKGNRRAISDWKAHMSNVCRVLCFTEDWSNPVLWSHYADKHYGMCLGFDVPDEYLQKVSYVPDRLPEDIRRIYRKQGTVGDEIALRMLSTKFADWQYEKELRMFINPEETIKEEGLEFFKFNSELILRSVILGARSKLAINDLRNIVDRNVEIIQSRLAFKTFKVVKQQNLKFKPIST